MPNRKTKVPVKSIPQIVEWILINATGQELDFMNGIANSTDLKVLANLIGKFKEYNVYEVFNSLVKDSHELEILRAAKRGEVAAFDAFLMACQAARFEIAKRRDGKI